MPVWKYHDVSEMPPPPAATDPDDIARRVRASWRRSRRFAPVRHPHGVFKFRNVEQAQRAREELRDLPRQPEWTADG